MSAKKPAQTRAGSSAAKPRGRPFKPGTIHAWKPGQSGNPSGLPKNRIETAAYIEQRLREEYLEQLVTALALHAIKGSPTHIVEALNRVAGKVTDKTELSGHDGGAIEVHHSDRFEEALKRIVGLTRHSKEDDSDER